MTTKTKKRNGFTLIEVIVVIAITGLLMALAIPAENSYRRRSEIQKSAKAIRSLFWEAQARSLAPRFKDVTSYKINLSNTTIGGAIINLSECRIIAPATTETCNPITGSEEPQVILGNNVVIEAVKLDTSPITGVIKTSFLVGNNKDSGQITFDPPGNKMTVTIGSLIYAPLKYDIVVDKQTGSITYGVVTP